MDLVAGRRQRDGALVVALEGQAIAVVAVAVGFDDHPLGRPEEVDEIALDQDVDLRQREAGLAAEGQEVDLQWRRSRLDCAQDRRRRATVAGADARPPRVLGQQPLELGQRSRPAPIGGDQRALQLPRVEAACHVQQRPLDGRHRDPRLDRRCRRLAASASDAAESLGRVLRRSGAVTSTGPREPRSPQSSAALPCESTAPGPQARTAAIHRPSRLIRDWPSAKTPRWSGNAGRPLRARSWINPFAKPKLKQLPPCDHPVLSLRQLANRARRFRSLASHRARELHQVSMPYMANLMRSGGRGGALACAARLDAGRTAAHAWLRDSDTKFTALPVTRVRGLSDACVSRRRRRPRRLAGVLARHQDQALELGDEDAVLVEHPGVDLDDAAVGLRLRGLDVEHLGLAEQGVAVEDRVGVAELFGRQVGDRLAGDVGDRHARAPASRRAARRRRCGPAGTASRRRR